MANQNNKDIEENKLNNFIESYKQSVLKRYRYNDSFECEGEETIWIDEIKKIDNIRVKVFLELSNEWSINIKVREFEFSRYGRDVYNECIYQGVSNDECDINHLYDELYKLDWRENIFNIINFKYNKTLHKLIDYTVDDDTLRYLGHEIEECCVCYENINYHMKCNHYLCHECYNKLERPVKCPLCREKAEMFD